MEPESPSSTESAPVRGSTFAVVEAYLEWSFIGFMAYTFSIGPMYWPWLNAKFGNGPLVIAAFYEPLFWLAGMIPPFGRWLDWYVNLWI